LEVIQPRIAPLTLFKESEPDQCYDAFVFNFGKPKTVGDWIVHIAGAIVALFLVWWMLRIYVL